ncbi:MAG TPA: glycosyltransferase family 9 protein [Alphaproteobacteria bacterium]|nr:glycosyltransferase family 9 protein [Alphaproteobacteria bacterium]
MRILFITSTRIGDAVLSSGLLAHLIARHPGARITIACGAAPAPLFAAVPGLDRLIVLNKAPLAGHWLRLWGAALPYRWHTIVDLRRTALAWMVLAGRRHRLGRERPGLHKVGQYAGLLGLEAEQASPHIWTDAAHLAAARQHIPDGPPVLALGPAANWPGKEWPAERFAALAEHLSGTKGPLSGGRLAVFAGPGERARARPVLEVVPEHRRIDLTDAIDLPTAHACLARCDFFVGNDSGLMHLAAAAGTPTLGLFGPSRDEHYAPWGAAAAVVRTLESYEDLVGAPGYDHRTTGTLMDGLTVEAAIEAARALIKRVGVHAA